MIANFQTNPIGSGPQAQIFFDYCLFGSTPFTSITYDAINVTGQHFGGNGVIIPGQSNVAQSFASNTPVKDSFAIYKGCSIIITNGFWDIRITRNDTGAIETKFLEVDLSGVAILHDYPAPVHYNNPLTKYTIKHRKTRRHNNN